MKTFLRNIILAGSIITSLNVNAQSADTVKHNSAKDLIELENGKNMIPTTKSNPPVIIHNNKGTSKTKNKPKKTRLKKSKKN